MPIFDENTYPFDSTSLDINYFIEWLNERISIANINGENSKYWNPYFVSISHNDTR